MATTQKNKKPKTEWKEEGKTFGWCYRKAKLYSRSMPGLVPYFYVVPFFLAYLVLDFTLRWTYRDAGVVGIDYLPAALFTLGWALIFTGLILALPSVPRWFFRCVPLVTFVTLAVTHSGFMNMMGEYFSFSVLTWGGTGEFFKASYIHINWRVVVGATITVLLMMIAGRFLVVAPPPMRKASVLTGTAGFLVGVILVALTHFLAFPKIESVLLTDPADAPVAAYEDFTLTTNSLAVSGLYQYSARDLWFQLFPADRGSLSDTDREQIETYIADYEAALTDNDYTGLLRGKNVMVIQMEAMDTWMITEEYTPTLARLRSEGINFSDHYTPGYISASSFNTEFLANTSLLPATGGVSSAVYKTDSYPYSLANLFRSQGYTARAFHTDSGATYSRAEVLPNLGFEHYYNGEALAMEEPTMDRYLLNGFDEMTEGQPFYSFVITYSAHGTYGPDNVIYQANAEKAQALAGNDPGNCVYAVAGAMETDRFVADLVARLEKEDLLNDTVLVFYTDHYNKYLMDDDYIMSIKGADNANLMLKTDFFLWSADLEPQTVTKVTSSADILPTLANLFALDTSGGFFVGDDGLSDRGGYVFFGDNSWYDGQTYWTYGTPGGIPERTAEISRKVNLCNRLLAGDYYAAIGANAP